MTGILIRKIEGFGLFWLFVFKAVTSPLRRGMYGRSALMRGHLWSQMYEIGILSVPVIMVTGAFVAMTLAVQTFNQLAQMGLEERLGSIINISVVKELGPVLAGLMLAGRVGGALTAELGTMKVTEQIDAVTVMGSDPIRYLVWPRLLACVLLTPMLIIFADIMGVLGGYVISVWHFGVNSHAYWQFSAQTVEQWDIVVGIAKGLFFGAIMALISCHKGFTCQRGASGVGRACTEAFVSSFIAILVMNFIVALVAKAIYDVLYPSKAFF
ncbi:MAG: ABC transporter permease [Phycisphaerae bacterium]|nr:ABC transporter permease [Phycisphaerae bacterium]